MALAAVVDALAEDAGGLLRSMEAHRVLGVDEVQAPLGLALELEDLRQGSLVETRLAGLLQSADQLHQGIFCSIHQFAGPFLGGLDSGLDLLLREAVAGLAGAGNVEQGASD